MYWFSKLFGGEEKPKTSVHVTMPKPASKHLSKSTRFLIVLPIMSFSLLAVARLAIALWPVVRGHGRFATEGFMNGVTVTSIFFAFMSAVSGVVLGAVSLTKPDSRRHARFCLAYSIVYLIFCILPLVKYVPQFSLYLLALPGLLPTIWRTPSCFVLADKKSFVAGSKLREIPLSRSLVLTAIGFMMTMAMIEDIVFPLPPYLHDSILFRYRYFMQTLVLGILLITVGSFALPSSKVLRSGLSVDRVFIAGILFACILGWQIFDWTQSLGSDPRTMIGLLATVCAALLADLGLVLAGKWKDAVGWTLIGFAVGLIALG